MYVAQRAQAFVGNGVSVPDPRPWRSGTDLLRDDFTVLQFPSLTSNVIMLRMGNPSLGPKCYASV